VKEQYYTDNTIDKQARLFLEEIKLFRTQHKFKFNRKKIALLVIDCQKFFFDAISHAFIPSANAIVPKIKKLQNYCFQHEIIVICTRHINTRENAQMMAKWWPNDLPQAGDILSEIIPELTSSQNIIITKSQYDAFYNSRLDTILKANEIKQLIITGVMTHLCCETTARVAFTRGYEVFFSIDSTATYNRNFHLSTLMNLSHGFAIPMLTDEILGKLQEK